MGLGLPASRVDSGSNFLAQQALTADAMRADFAIRAQRGVVGLLSALARQTDCRDTWDDAGRHRIVRRPLADTALPVLVTLQDGDLLTESIGVARSPVRDLVNEVEAKWKVYSPTGQTSRAETVVNAASQANPRFGAQQQVLDLVLIADDATAQLVATRKVDRQGKPRWVASVNLPLFGLRFRQGDLVAISSREFSFSVCEIVEVTLATGGFARVTLKLAVWNT